MVAVLLQIATAAWLLIAAWLAASDPDLSFVAAFGTAPLIGLSVVTAATGVAARFWEPANRLGQLLAMVAEANATATLSLLIFAPDLELPTGKYWLVLGYLIVGLLLAAGAWIMLRRSRSRVAGPGP